MTWLVIDDADNSVVDGPVDVEPVVGAGQRVVEVALGCVWSPARNGFVDAPPATPPRILTPQQYFQLFTADEQLAIIGAPVRELQRAVVLTLAAPSLSLDDPIVIGGLEQMAAAGFLTVERATQIQAGLPPEPA